MSRLAGARWARRRYVDLPQGQIHFLESAMDVPGSMPLVMLHPTASSSVTFLEVIRRLEGEYRVIAPDSPGFGSSDPLEGEVTVPAMASVIVEALTALDVDRFWLYGNHTGAVLAASIAVSHPDRVERLMLSGPPLPSAERKAQMAAAVRPMMIEEDGGHLVRLWDRYRSFLVSAGLEVPHRELALHLIATAPEETFHAVIGLDLAALYRGIGCPTMVTSGDRDTLRPGSDDVVGLIGGGVFELIPDAGNFVVDEAPEAVAAQIRAWFV